MDPNQFIGLQTQIAVIVSNNIHLRFLNSNKFEFQIVTISPDVLMVLFHIDNLLQLDFLLFRSFEFAAGSGSQMFHMVAVVHKLSTKAPLLCRSLTGELFRPIFTPQTHQPINQACYVLYGIVSCSPIVSPSANTFPLGPSCHSSR